MCFLVQMVQQFLEPLRLKGLRLRIAAPTIFFIGAWKKLVVQQKLRIEPNIL